MTNKQRLKWIAAIVASLGAIVAYRSVAEANCTSGWQTTWTNTASCSTNGRTGQSVGANGGTLKTLWASCTAGSCASPYQAESTGATSGGTTVCWVATNADGSSNTTNCNVMTAVKHKVGVYGP